MSEVIPFNRGVKPHEFFLKFMDSEGHKRDAETYMSLFQSLPRESFAVVVIDEEVVREELDALIFDLRYLMQISLFPVIFVRAADSMLKAMEVENYFKKARIPVTYISRDLTNEEVLEAMRSTTAQNKIPLVKSDAKNDFVADMTSFLDLMNTKRVLLLRRDGGFVNQIKRKKISLINLKFERDTLLGAGVLSAEERSLLQQTDELVRTVQHSIYVSICSPTNMLRELFTVKGAGTLVQFGSSIEELKAWEEVNKGALQKLIESAHYKRLKEQFLSLHVDHFYVAENYQGAALVMDVGEMAYLSKFAVGTQARGFGVGQDLWTCVNMNHPKVFWRSDRNAFITKWYEKNCDGMHREGRWTVFWKGLETDQIPEAIDYALKQDDDFFYEA